MNNALCITDPGVGVYIQWVILSLMGLSAWIVLQTGRISLGQQAYFGIGAYTAAIITVLVQGTLVQALIVAFMSGTLLAFVISRVIHKLNGLQYALATLAIAELVRLALSSWQWRISDKDGNQIGPDGIYGFREIRWLFENQISPNLYLSASVLALFTCMGLILLIANTKNGLAIRTVGLDSELAALQGEDTSKLQILTQSLSGGIGALSGALYAHHTTYVEPAVFDVMLGIHAVGYAMIGGVATPFGPLLGSAFDLGLLETTRLFEGWRMVIFGGLVALFLRWRPGGLLNHHALYQFSKFIQGRKS